MHPPSKGGFIGGILDAGFETVVGVGHMITHPKETAKGLWHIATHPVETAKALGRGVKGRAQAILSGDTHAAGRTFFDIFSTLVAPEAKAAKVADVSADLTKATPGVLRAAIKESDTAARAMSPKTALAAETRLNSSNALAGVERASPELLASVAKRRTVQIATEGSEEMRYLDYMGAEANVGGEAMTHILLRPNPSKAGVLEEFLHGTQHRLGMIERLGVSGAEWHVKDFMIRHSRLLGLSAEDVRRLTILRDMGL